MSETNRCEGPARTPVYYEDEPSEPLGAQCVPVMAPVESKPESPPTGRDRSPYAPGAAPIRIPEAPMVIRG